MVVGMQGPYGLWNIDGNALAAVVVGSTDDAPDWLSYSPASGVVIPGTSPGDRGEFWCSRTWNW